MDVIEAIRGRASTRAYLDKPVPREVVQHILEAARWAPSGVNTQPWRVWVVTGAAKQRLGVELLFFLGRASVSCMRRLNRRGGAL